MSSTAETGPPKQPQSIDEAVEKVDYVSLRDETANVLTHGIGVVLSLVAMLYFWNLAADQHPGLRWSCVIFTISMATVYLFSTLSHAVQTPLWRNRMRAWDQGTIYLLIVGTYTPFIWQGSPTGYRTLLLVLVWTAGLAGFYSKVLAKHRINGISTVSYVLLGWLPAIPLFAHTPWICFGWMIGGGLCYSAGIFFLMRSHLFTYAHATWHIMVMLGSACHCYAIYLLLQRI